MLRPKVRKDWKKTLKHPATEKGHCRLTTLYGAGLVHATTGSLKRIEPDTSGGKRPILPEVRGLAAANVKAEREGKPAEKKPAAPKKGKKAAAKAPAKKATKKK